MLITLKVYSTWLTSAGSCKGGSGVNNRKRRHRRRDAITGREKRGDGKRGEKGGCEERRRDNRKRDVREEIREEEVID